MIPMRTQRSRGQEGRPPSGSLQPTAQSLPPPRLSRSAEPESGEAQAGAEKEHAQENQPDIGGLAKSPAPPAHEGDRGDAGFDRVGDDLDEI